MPTIEQLFAPLNEEQRENLNASERQERLPMLARYLTTTEDELLHSIAEAAGMPVVENLPPPGESVKALPLRLIHEYQCFPLEQVDAQPGTLPLVTVWPPDAQMTRWIIATAGLRPIWHLGPAGKVADTITQVFGVGSGSLDDPGLEGFSEAEEASDIEDEDAAIIRFVNEVIAKAITDRATDIHFEPQKESLTIRYRIDGQLVPVRVPENLRQYQRAIISRIKIMARLNISERRRPQDGRISFTSGSDELDIRISTLPTMYGESVSLRLLNQKSQPVSIQELGILPDDVERIAAPLQRPHGIILVTGPTGSGKSTTLNAFMRRIRTPERRIITVEDPVEYEIQGINQTQIHPEIGLTFAAALRHVLRQDPDVIMVGEIRDRETADIAVRASLTGHLVLSTLHTNDAPGALTRLIDMEIEPFLIASSVEMIIAQRLVRRLCEHCRRPADYDLSYIASCLIALKQDPNEAAHRSLVHEAVGCEHCRNLGFRGRIGLFEILRVTEEMHELIVQRRSARVIREVALSRGMRTLQGSGWAQVKRGLTTLSEVMRFADLIDEEEEKAVESMTAET